MRIDSIIQQGLIQNYRPGGKAAPQAKGKVSGGNDQVSFSEQAVSFSRLFSEIREQMETRSTEDRARITDIADRIDRGEYHVDSGKVAARILSDLI